MWETDAREVDQKNYALFFVFSFAFNSKQATL